MTKLIAIVFALMAFAAPARAQSPATVSAIREPEMVRIPAGSFTMGSPVNEREGGFNEAQHSVNVRAFMAGRYEVSFDEWDACVADGGCGGYRPSDQGWGRGERPVTNVSWDDAQKYVAWLKQKTAKQYRLLTDSEWEYAARAGTLTAYFWGNSIGVGNANCDGCGSKWDNKQTAPVGSFRPNAFGLYDMAGNVWQWTQDCYSTTLSNSDGGANTSGDCSQRVLRGGSWHLTPQHLRSAHRHRDYAIVRDMQFGFRVARTL